MRRTEVIEQIKDIIRHVAPTAKTILYGSQARNEARSDSDIDLLILLDGEKITLKEEEAITLPLYELELKTGISIYQSDGYAEKTLGKPSVQNTFLY